MQMKDSFTERFLELLHHQTFFIVKLEPYDPPTLFVTRFLSSYTETEIGTCLLLTTTILQFL